MSDSTGEIFDESAVTLTLDELEFGEEIGKGSFGLVYRGKFKGNDVAIKKAVIPGDEMVKYLRSELAALGSQSHPNLIHYFGAAQSGRDVYIVTKYMPGGSLTPLLTVPDVEMPWALRVCLARDIINAIAHLHSADMIHRDVKTDNILLDDDWNAVLTDYGFAKKVKDLRSGGGMTSTLLGTDAFIAPEIQFSEPYGAAADVFSFGCVLAEIITGKTPGINGFLERLPRNKFAPDIDAFRESVSPDCPPSFLECACQCMSYEPEERPSAEDTFLWLDDLAMELMGELEAESAKDVATKANIPAPSKLLASIADRATDPQ